MILAAYTATGESGKLTGSCRSDPCPGWTQRFVAAFADFCQPFLFSDSILQFRGCRGDMPGPLLVSLISRKCALKLPGSPVQEACIVA